MNYKYKKKQIFGKKLQIPKSILKKVYDCSLSLSEYFEYHLDDKIPISCIIVYDRAIIEKFGISRCKNLDWEFINMHLYNNFSIHFHNIIMSIDSDTKDINKDLYELVKDKITPINYSSKMKEIYSDRLFNVPITNDVNLIKLTNQFNKGETSLNDIVENWNLFKNKDLSYCLLKDDKNINYITDTILKKFMLEYGNLVPLVSKRNNVYKFISDVLNCNTEEEKYKYIKNVTDNILKNNSINNEIKLDDNEYKEIFKYSSLEDFLKKIDDYRTHSLIEELKTLPKDYIFNIPIPFSKLLNGDILTFIHYYGLKNVVDFDNECNHYFTKNNCSSLGVMNDKYIVYGRNSIFPSYDEEGNYINGPYTKDDFYERMRRIIITGPTNHKYFNENTSYREIRGEFRNRFPELFLDENAPEELQELFYTKSITSQLILEHPEYIKYLIGKDLSSCFRYRDVKIIRNNLSTGYKNIYKYLSSKTDTNGIFKYINEFNSLISDFNTNLEFSEEDNIEQIIDKSVELLREQIIKKGFSYSIDNSNELFKKYPSMFLDKNAPQELKNAFYNRTITLKFILNNPSYIEYLKNIDQEILFKYMPIKIKNSNGYENVNFVKKIKQVYGSDFSLNLMILYGKYIENIFAIDQLRDLNFDPEFSKEELLTELDKLILKNIIDGNLKYDENMPEHFKKNNPTLFLDNSISEDIKIKFYSREFTLNDFNDNPNLLTLFKNTNIAYGFPKKMSWIISTFNDIGNVEKENCYRMKLISTYSKINDYYLQSQFKDLVMEYGNNIDFKKIEFVSDILSKLSLSNSIEIFTFRKELALQLLKADNPLNKLNKIEEVFIKNNIPTVGKIYSCFEILHPNFQGFDFDNSIVSPILKKSSTLSREIIVFSDLIKSSFGSNNRSVNAYLNNIEYGSNLYKKVKTGQVKFETLSLKEKNELKIFCNHLKTLYDNTKKGKKDIELFTLSGNVINDISELEKKISPDGSVEYNIEDRVIRMFCGFAGIDTLKQAKEYVIKKVVEADLRNRNASKSDLILEQGDFVKGIGNIQYLRNILQNGSVSKEYLGSCSSSDLTPLDTDISMILNSSGTISEKINNTASSTYGPIWFVLKNDDRFLTTRTSDELPDTKRDISKLEVFYTGVSGKSHYGIRTGFASSEIDYIVMREYDPKVGLEIAMNGFYIPVSDMNGKIIFTPKDYDELRTKMKGLSFFGDETYSFSDNLITEETEFISQQIEQNNLDILSKKEKINNIIKKSLEELGLVLKTEIDGDLTNGYVELIDTGSTGRGTNKLGDGDFDFMMRLDKNILSDSSKLNKLKNILLRNLGKENSNELTAEGDFRLKKVQIDKDVYVDIDITFNEKTDKIVYSTDMSLRDRLSTIKSINPEKYKYVIANILTAKNVLKNAEVYKPDRGDIPQGGLGGVGIENWILQNGGSFIDAAKSFLEHAEGKSFSDFKLDYQIWDFGDNHLADRRGKYVHDNFVSNNMSESGYKKMVQVLKDYLKMIENSKEISKEINR